MAERGRVKETEKGRYEDKNETTEAKITELTERKGEL